ncbi:alpha-n-acetylgalactosaminidase-like [Plakobranchus ocellatus]|uniref:Alpha-galactosidase n=1 Tax=Plakobranchus ocellatus TaxID=259542 RepID=A0AAV4DM55_9GAST|nr:alpha-n-acetylgalactosaminidase-like [Plakobranchus ocellatus]
MHFIFTASRNLASYRLLEKGRQGCVKLRIASHRLVDTTLMSVRGYLLIWVPHKAESACISYSVRVCFSGEHYFPDTNFPSTMFVGILAVGALLCQLSVALDNGLARTPPMGWLSWERFRCNTDCKNDPDHCISEQLYKRQADLMVSEGYRDVGYQYVNIDDCWPAMERDKDGKLVADPIRFPSGIKALARYMHSKGLKLGIYEDFGSKTCAGYPGSEFYMQTDANTFAEWEVDSLKFDGCNSDPKDMPYGYPIMGKFLNMTGRPILFNCQWPGYLVGVGIQPDYAAVRNSCNQWRNFIDVQDDWVNVLKIIDHYGNDKDNSSAFAGPGGWNDPDMSDYRTIAKTCNIWRNYVDVTDSWDSIVDIINTYGKDEGNFSAVAAPGGFNDPDMLVVGDFGLSYYQQKAQFGMWALFAAPLMMSNDLSNIRDEAKALLQNKNIIAINQDPLGNQAVRLFEVPGSISVWVKKLAKPGSRAIGVLNINNQGTPQKYTTSFSDLGFTNKKGYNVREAFENKTMGSYGLDQKFTIYVDPTSIFIMFADPQ